MLAALLLLGVLPFAVMPLMEDDGGSQEPEDPPDTDTQTTLELDHETQTTPEPDPEVDLEDSDLVSDLGETYTLDATPGTTVIDGFTPGTDTLGMNLTAVQGDLYFDMSSSADGATFSISVGEDIVSTVEFPDLAEVPAGDIFLTLIDDETGESFETSLTDAIALTEGVIDPLDPLDPLDPDLPDEPGPDVGDDPVLDSIDPDQPDDPGPVGPFDDAVLEPLDPDLPEAAGDANETLETLLLRNSESPGAAAAVSEAIPLNGTIETELGAGAGNDTIDTGDEAAHVFGGVGDDLFWVYSDGADGALAAEVTDFKVGEDFLRVSLNPQIGENDEPDVMVLPSEDGSDGLVMVNGELVAILRGAPGATASDVFAEVKLDFSN